MELDEHCLKILASLEAGDISYSYAQLEMEKHGDSLLRKVLENGFTATYTDEKPVGIIGK